ncbi:hypothetical protein [uncultured Photobacterium sp.]|uniref:hypothetical protein n=1 Tax=uncultured Photobacterium sp. TaxID=173973 RepID=UPI00261E3152|nr:hypothetical protein [uncultured Photobacterium sp.]
MNKKYLVIALGLSSSMGLVGCNDDNNSGNSTVNPATPSTPATSYSVTAIDGYLKNAQVWLDLDGDFQLDEGEPSAITGDGGKADLDVTGINNPKSYPVIVRSIKGKTLDEDTGNTVAADYVMSAPAGEQHVTPLSTLVHVRLETNSSLDKEQAIAEVASELGIDDKEVLGDFIEEKNSEAAFGARNLVSAGILPKTPAELKTEADENAPGTLLSKATTANTTIKTFVEQKKQEAQEQGEELDLSNQLMDKEGNIVSDNDADGVPNTDDFAPDDPEEWLDSDSDGTGDNADSDDDNDNTPDELDAFPFDPTETIDTDGDFIGNNADNDDDNDRVLDNDDAFPLDSTESLDFDKDGIGNNADTDDDNDGTEDKHDAFPFDPTETIDTDGDQIGNNADTDDDNDNVIDTEDSFPLDSSETTDTDGDGIGNNRDTDDDNDGIDDENDIAPTDPNAGLSDIAKVIAFFQESGNIYVPFTDGNDQEGEKLVVEKFTINGTDASLATRYVVNADKSLSENPSSEHTEVLMTANGWTTIADQFAVSMSDNRITVYPANAPEMTYTASGAVKDLTEQLIASNSGEWGEKVNQQAHYPQGAAGAVLTLTANTDMYELDDHSPWFWHGNNGQDDGQNAISLTEIQSSTAAGNGAPVSTTKGISLGHEIGVELVQDGTANYYNWQWQQGTVTLVGSNSWTMKTINGEEILEFTVPEAVISQWGNNWNYDTPHLLLSNHDGKIRFGSFTPAGTTEDDDSALLLNSIAYNAMLEAVDMSSAPASLKTCTTGDSSEKSAATKADFEQALTDCGGVSEPISTEMLTGKNFHRVNSEGEKRDYTFNADGTVSVYKNNVEAYKQNWAINGNYVVLTETWGENGEASSEWIWALLDRNDSQWSVKFYDSETYRNEQNNLVTENYVWSTVFDLQPVNTAPACNIQEVETGATLEGFNTQLAACSDTLPTVSYANIANGALTRVNSTDQARAYVFHSDNTATYYKNGQPKSRIWNLDTEGTLKIAANETAEFYDLLRVINEGSGELEFAVFSNEDNAIWKTNYKDFDPNINLVECEVMNSPWDDANNRPLVFSSYEEFKQSIIECQAIQNGTSDTRIAKFSTDFIGSGIVLAASSDNEYEEYRLNDDGTGTYTFRDESENGTEQLTWSIHEDSILKIEINFTDVSGVAHTANDYLAIISTNGIQFSLKIFSQSTEWQSVNPNGGGDLWGGVFSYPEAK